MISKKALYLPLLLLVSSNIFTAGRRSSHHRAAAPQQTAYSQPAQTYNQPSAYREHSDEQDAPVHHAQHTSGSISEITSKHELQEALQSSEPTIIYVTAKWCEACTQQMEPVINKAAEKYGHQVSFKKLDYDKFKKEAENLGVDGLPRVLFSRSGKRITVKGSRPESYFLNQVEQFINNRLQPEQESTTSASRAKRK